jgi:hypothetical protein
VIGLFLALLLSCLRGLGLTPDPPPPSNPIDASATCPLGCVVMALQDHGGERYQVTSTDVFWLAKVVYREAGPRFRGREAGATAWALVQSWARDRRRRGGHGFSLAGWVQRYSAGCSRDWATGGTRYSPRITPRADACRALRWDQIPDQWQDFVEDFFAGRVPNDWPGVVHVLARGFERFAADDLSEPIYASDAAGGNAYYRTDDTADWPVGLVRIIPARDWR